MGYGVGAVVSTVHDLLITIGFFVLFDRQFNASMVAAILLIIGYSINDTIVVFDRIREELKLNPTGTLREIVNRSLNLTLSRTIITSGTVFIVLLAMVIFGGPVIRGFSWIMTIGIISGTYSTLFIVPAVAVAWDARNAKRRAAAPARVDPAVDTAARKRKAS